MLWYNKVNERDFYKERKIVGKTFCLDFKYE